MAAPLRNQTKNNFYVLISWPPKKISNSGCALQWRAYGNTDFGHFWQIFDIFDQSCGWKWPLKAIVESKTWNFSHQNSALPMIFFKILQKARISRIFQNTSFWKNWASQAELFDQKLEPKPSQTEPKPRLGSNTSSYNC